MAKEEGKGSSKKKVAKKATSVTSVRSYKNGIEVEKQKMGEYSKKFGTSVRSLQGDFKKHAKELKEAAKNMREEGAKHMGSIINKFKGEIKAATKSMNDKVDKYKGDIKAQIKENKEAVSHMEGNVKFLLGEINKKKNDFKAYAKGPFNSYIKAFWG